MNRFSALSIDGETSKPSAFKHAMAAKKQGAPLSSIAVGKPVVKENPLTKDNFPSLCGATGKSAPVKSCWKSVDTIKAAVNIPTPESKFKQNDNKVRVKTPPLDIDRYYNDPTYVAIVSKTGGVSFVDEYGNNPELPSYLRSEVEGYEVGDDEEGW